MPGVHGTGTYIDYRKVAHQFSEWCAARGVRGNWEAGKSLVEEYIRACEAEGLAPDTLHKYRSALRKAFRDHELGPSRLPPRRKDQITRSRQPREMHKHVDTERWRDVIAFALATGLRRRELAEVRAEDVYRREAGRLMVHVRRGKGGQPREVHVLSEFEDRVLQIISGEDAREVLFPRIPQRLDIHSFRREYLHVGCRSFGRPIPVAQNGSCGFWSRRTLATTAPMSSCGTTCRQKCCTRRVRYPAMIVVRADLTQGGPRKRGKDAGRGLSHVRLVAWADGEWRHALLPADASDARLVAIVRRLLVLVACPHSPASRPRVFFSANWRWACELR